MRAKLSKEERLILVESLAEAFDKARKSRSSKKKEQMQELYNLANRLTKATQGRPDLVYGYSFQWGRDSAKRYAEHFQNWIKQLKEEVTRDTKGQLEDPPKDRFGPSRSW